MLNFAAIGQAILKPFKGASQIMAGSNKSNAHAKGGSKAENKKGPVDDGLNEQKEDTSKDNILRDGLYTVVKDVGDTVSDILYPTPEASNHDMDAKHKDALKQIKELREKIKHYGPDKTHKKR